jgi:hypothetical protein
VSYFAPTIGFAGLLRPWGYLRHRRYDPLRRAAVLPILPAALFVFESVFVLLAIEHASP